MLRVIAGKEPSLYLGEGNILKYKGNSDVSILNPWERIKERGMARVRHALERLFQKLTEFSLTFSIKDIKVEQDPEVAGWRYVVAEIELNLSPGLFPQVEDFLIDYTYSSLSPEQATKLLVIFHNV